MPSIISEAINNQATDPYSSLGYSLVDVNVWSMTVDSILSTIAKLNSNVRVVSPDAFVKLFKTGTMCEGQQSGINDNTTSLIKLNCLPNPASNSVKVEVFMPIETDAELAIYDICGQKLQTISSSHLDTGQHSLELDISRLSIGVYFIALKGPAFSVSQKLVVVN